MNERVIEFKIIGEPIPKLRPRFFKQGKFVRTYTPKVTRKWEEFVRMQALEYRPKNLLQGPLRLELRFYMPKPKSLPKKVKHHTKRPDIENLAKSILDALQGVFYRNDSQIYSLYIKKEYSERFLGVDIKIIETS